MALALENVDVWIGTALGTLKGRVSTRFDTAFAEFFDEIVRALQELASSVKATSAIAIQFQRN